MVHKDISIQRGRLRSNNHYWCYFMRTKFLRTKLAIFIYEKSKEKINFLDVVIKIKKDRIINDLYYQSMDGRQYLHYDWCHADHIERSITFIKYFWLKRICSGKNNLNVHVEDLKTWFHKRGNPGYLISEQVEKAIRLIPRDESNSKQENDVLWIVTYNPAF